MRERLQRRINIETRRLVLQSWAALGRGPARGLDVGAVARWSTDACCTFRAGIHRRAWLAFLITLATMVLAVYLTHRGFYASEGPTVHIGAAIMAETRRLYPHRSLQLERRLLIAGAAAGCLYIVTPATQWPPSGASAAAFPVK